LKNPDVGLPLHTRKWTLPRKLRLVASRCRRIHCTGWPKDSIYRVAQRIRIHFWLLTY